jgi:hypothetical protein
MTLLAVAEVMITTQSDLLTPSQISHDKDGQPSQGGERRPESSDDQSGGD